MLVKFIIFSTDIELEKGDKVVVETARGVELGEISRIKINRRI